MSKFNATLEIKVDNGWWGIYNVTEDNAEKIMSYALSLTGVNVDTPALSPKPDAGETHETTH